MVIVTLEGSQAEVPEGMIRFSALAGFMVIVTGYVVTKAHRDYIVFQCPCGLYGDCHAIYLIDWQMVLKDVSVPWRALW